MMEHHRVLSEKIVELQKQQEDIAHAADIIKRYSPKDERSAKPISTKGTPRPHGLPTSSEMIEAVLAETGNKGLGISALVKAIADKYWPGLVTSQIAPTIYEMAKRGRIIKSADGIFKRKKG
jgi:hypothetical protein